MSCHSKYHFPFILADNDEPSSSHYAGCSHVGSESEMKVIKLGHKRRKSSNSQLEVSLSGSGKTIDFSAPVSCVKINRSTGDNCENGIALKKKLNCSDSRMISHRTSSQWISIKTNDVSMNSDSSTKRPHLLKDGKANSEVTIGDPFAFDEVDLEPSKWELLANSKDKIQDHGCDLTTKKLLNGCELSVISTNDVLSQLTNEEIHQNDAKSHTSEIDEDLSLVDDCLLTSVKVFWCFLFICVIDMQAYFLMAFGIFIKLYALQSFFVLDKLLDRGGIWSDYQIVFVVFGVNDHADAAVVVFTNIRHYLCP